jgi:hypothetical protein
MVCVLSAHAVEPLYEADFDRADEPLIEQLKRRGQVKWSQNGGRDGTGAVRVPYVGYERGSKRIVTQLKLKKHVRDASLTFDVLFEKEFIFAKGGKLHGLGPADPATGGEKLKDSDWSARMMFTDGGLKTYSYSRTTKKNPTVSKRTVDGFTFEKDRFYRLTLHVRLNDVGKANGFSHIYIDGKKAVEEYGLEFRRADDDRSLIQRLLFNTFHGGSSKSWAPKNDDGSYATVYARFDNLAVYEGLVLDEIKE